MFDINSILKSLEGKFPTKIVNEAIQSLVKKGILEQYVEEDGNFSFQLTDFGTECAEEIFQDPMSLFDFDDLDGLGDEDIDESL